MNRIFRTVWNDARKALVVVNEKTRIGQGRRAARGGHLIPWKRLPHSTLQTI